MAHTCKQCGNCCKYLEFVFHKSEFDIEFYRARGLTIWEYDTHFVIEVPHICKNLGDDNKCKIHDNKPDACKEWPQFMEDYPNPCRFGDEDDMLKKL